MATLIRKCTRKEFKKNERCKFCDHFEKTESMIDSDNSFFVWNGLCHKQVIPCPRKSSDVCSFFVSRGFRAYSKPGSSVPLQMPD